MEILDPDLWNDDGTPKRPSQEYMQRLNEAQRDVGVVAATGDPELSTNYLNYARIKREARENRAPEIGDIVHFWDDEMARCRAAIVMEVEPFNDVATLRVHVPHEASQDWTVDHGEDKAPTTWHWPCGEGR